MKIAIFPIVSSLHDGSVIDGQTLALIDDLERCGHFDVAIVGLRELYSADLSLILIQSGGSEGIFLDLKKHFKSPYYILTYGSNNSLAASMEILSYLKSSGEEAEILHGSAQSIADRLRELKNRPQEKPINLGVIGKPSDWLIASHVDKRRCLDKLNINLIDIDIKELTDLFQTADIVEYRHPEKLIFDDQELGKAKKVAVGLEKLIQKYDLKGLTVRCFDLLGSIRTTGCLGLSILNKNGIIGTCEGDVPAMLSMYLLHQITGQSGFMANPSRIDTETNQIILAHCTVPLDMVTEYTIKTHFESGIGVAIQGKLTATDVTLFKLGNDLRHYYVAEGKILANLNDPNLCRTQIKVQLDDVRYFLTSPYGNHHIVVYGSHQKAIKNHLDKIL
jgi:L-fucose isomerase-like protein